MNSLDNYFFFKIKKLKKRALYIKQIFSKKKFNKFLNTLNEYSFVRLFLLSLFKIFIKIIKIILSFVGFVIYAVWSYFNTILLYAIGYILLEFGATRIYDPNQDITSREIWEIISKKLYFLKKKYFSKNNILHVSNIFLKNFIDKILLFSKFFSSFFIFVYYKLFFINKNTILNFYSFFTLFVLLFTTNNVLLFKKMIYLKKNLNNFFYNFKLYLCINYLKIFINLFKKKKIFFLNKNFFKEKKLLNLLNYKLYILSFKTYLKIEIKLKYKMLYIKNIFQFNRFKNYFCYRIKFWSTQKRFLHFYLKLLKKSKKVKMGALRVIYIEEWWVYKFYLKNYYFNTFLKIIIIVYNLIKIKMIFIILYLNFILKLIFF